MKIETSPRNLLAVLALGGLFGLMTATAVAEAEERTRTTEPTKITVDHMKYIDSLKSDKIRLQEERDRNWDLFVEAKRAEFQAEADLKSGVALAGIGRRSTVERNQEDLSRENHVLRMQVGRLEKAVNKLRDVHNLPPLPAFIDVTAEATKAKRRRIKNPVSVEAALKGVEGPTMPAPARAKARVPRLRGARP